MSRREFEFIDFERYVFELKQYYKQPMFCEFELMTEYNFAQNCSFIIIKKCSDYYVE